MRGIETFEKWFERIERIDENVADEIAREIPPEWYEDDLDALYRLLEQLLRRRKLVPELIQSAWKSTAQPFPNWRCARGVGREHWGTDAEGGEKFVELARIKNPSVGRNF